MQQQQAQEPCQQSLCSDNDSEPQMRNEEPADTWASASETEQSSHVLAIETVKD